MKNKWKTWLWLTLAAVVASQLGASNQMATAQTTLSGKESKKKVAKKASTTMPLMRNSEMSLTTNCQVSTPLARIFAPKLICLSCYGCRGGSDDRWDAWGGKRGSWQCSNYWSWQTGHAQLELKECGGKQIRQARQDRLFKAARVARFPQLLYSSESARKSDSNWWNFWQQGHSGQRHRDH